MGQPPTYTRQYNFNDFATTSPSAPLPGDKVDAELNAAKLTLDELNANIALIQRDDGKLGNTSVHKDAFDAGALALMSTGSMTPRGSWSAGVSYAVSDLADFNNATYLATSAHTSASAFTTDLAASRWILLANAAISGTANSVDKFSGTGSQTAFTLTSSYASNTSVLVFVNGALRNPGDDYSISGTTLTFVTAPPVPSVVGNENVIAWGPSAVAQAASDAALASSSNASGFADEAESWASKVNGIVESTDYSSKAYAIGGTGVDAGSGSAKDWATKTGGTVGNTSEYSAKYWATQANVGTVAGAIASVNTVAGISANVTTVAGVSTSVSALSASGVLTSMAALSPSTNITNMATLGASGVVADIATVAGVASDVSTVAGVASDVTTVAGVSGAVSSVAALSASDLTTVAGVASDVSTVAANAVDLQTVADEIDNNKLQTVATNIAAVVTAANDLNEATSEIDTVATNITNVNNVGGSITNVNTVASNLTNVNAFHETYSIGTSDPTSSLEAGDLFYNQTTNKLRYYDGTSWVDTTAIISYSVGDGGLTANNFTDDDHTKLNNIDTNANNYSLPLATSSVRGGIELASDTAQTVAANTVTTTASRTYGVQLNSDNQAVVNVPWVDTNTDTNTTYSLASSSVRGLVKIGYGENGKNYPVELDSEKMFVNVPWTDTDTVYTLPLATNTVRGGIELFSDTDQTVAANTVTNTAGRTYGVQLNASNQAVVNVPWVDTNTDTNTTYSLASSSVRGLVKIGYGENGKNYPVELDSEKMFVNVPWTDTVYSLPLATSSVQGGIELFSDTDQTVAANTVTNTAGRTYGVQLNASNQAVVNVPWVDTNTDTNTTYSLASDTALGLVKVGFTESGKNYPVELDSEKMFVNVPWTDTNTVYTHPTTAGNIHIPSGGSSGQILGYASAGTAQWQAAGGGDADSVDGKSIAVVTALPGSPDANTIYFVTG